MHHQIIDPVIPYIGALSRGDFAPEKSIKIQGLTPSTAYRFYINLQCGPTPQNDLALQIAVHILDGYIALNSSENEIWGEEQRGALPIKRSKMFEIVLTCDINWYKISIDGQHYAEFPQRIHYNCITYLAISGDVSIFRISYESASRTSENRLGEVLRPSAPISSGENDGNDFEVISTAASTTNADIHPLPFSDSSAPPSYDAAIELSKTTPYPTNDLMGMPHPSGVPKHTSTAFLPYPVPASSKMHLGPYRPIGIDTSLTRLPEIPPPVDNAPVPLNAGSSNIRSAVRSNTTGLKEVRCIMGTIFGIIAIVALLLKFTIGK